MTSQFKPLLLRAMQQKDVISVHYEKSDYDSAYCGIVESLNEEECRMSLYKRFGIADGFRAFRLSDIVFVDIGGAFEHRITYFMPSARNTFTIPRLQPITNGPIMIGTLRQAQELGLIVSLWLNDGQYNISGFVDSITSEVITIAEHDTFGSANGETTIQIENVDYVICGSSQCVHVQSLIEHQQEFLEFRKQQIR